MLSKCTLLHINTYVALQIESSLVPCTVSLHDQAFYAIVAFFVFFFFLS